MPKSKKDNSILFIDVPDQFEHVGNKNKLNDDIAGIVQRERDLRTRIDAIVADLTTRDGQSGETRP